MFTPFLAACTCFGLAEMAFVPGLVDFERSSFNPDVKRILHSDDGDVQTLAFSLDGKSLATGTFGDTKALVIWDVVTGKEKYTLVGHKRCSLVAFLPDGKSLVANCGPEWAYQVWDVEARKVRLVFKPDPPLGPPYALSADGQWLAGRDGEDAIHLHSLTTGQAVAKFKALPKARSLAFTADGKRLACGHYGGAVLVWDVRSGTRLAELNGHGFAEIVTCCFSSDGKILYTVDDRCCFLEWDVATLKELRKTDLRKRLRQPIRWAALSPDGRILALQTKGELVLYDLQNRKLREDFTGDGQWGQKYCIAFSPDGKFIATGAGWSKPKFNCVYLWTVPPVLEPQK